MLFAALHERSQSEPLFRRNRPWQKNNEWLYGLKKATGNAAPLQHLVHLPPQYDAEPGKRWPTIVFLHGSGERGDDMSHLWRYGILKRIRQGANLPFIVICPQCPANESWAPQQVIDLLDQILPQYRVDPERIYLTGLSMGGSGTWETAARFPARFAAIVPICGSGDPLEAERLKDLPVWAFHGAKDDVVPVSGTKDVVDALRKIGGRVRCTIYPEARHDSFTPAYATDELYTWLLEQRRGHPAEPPATLPANR
jgi:predicted peptidase